MRPDDSTLAGKSAHLVHFHDGFGRKRAEKCCAGAHGGTRTHDLVGRAGGSNPRPRGAGRGLEPTTSWGGPGARTHDLVGRAGVGGLPAGGALPPPLSPPKFCEVAARPRRQRAATLQIWGERGGVGERVPPHAARALSISVFLQQDEEGSAALVHDLTGASQSQRESKAWSHAGLNRGPYGYWPYALTS